MKARFIGTTMTFTFNSDSLPIHALAGRGTGTQLK